MNNTGDKRNFGRMSLQNELKMRRKLLMCKKIASDIRGHWAKIEELETQFMNCFDTSTYSNGVGSGFNPVNELFGNTDFSLNEDKIDVDVMRSNFMTSLYREIMQYRDTFDVLNKNINHDMDLIRTMINKDNTDDSNDNKTISRTDIKNDYLNNRNLHMNDRPHDNKYTLYNNITDDNKTISRIDIINDYLINRNLHMNDRPHDNNITTDENKQYKCDSSSCRLNTEAKLNNSLYSQKKEQVKEPSPNQVKRVVVDKKNTAKEEKYNAIDRFIKSTVVNSDEDGENEIINDINL